MLEHKAHSTPEKIALFLMPVLALATLLPDVSSATGLMAGLIISAIFGNPYIRVTRRYVSPLLQISIIGLGAGMNLGVIGRVGAQGVVYTMVGISSTMALGWVLSRWLRIGSHTGTLISVGTAICGGSAIAAVAPVLQAKEQEVSVALGTIFILNAIALCVFPWIGTQLNLSQQAFGLWSALAIHDTSSVVGATMHYGAEALTVGTTLKLARALWIAPVALIISVIHARSQGSTGKRAAIKIPWFILGFLAAAALVTVLPALQPTGQLMSMVAKRSLVLTLFLIGANLTPSALKKVGWRPLIHSILLWISVGGATLAAVKMGVIH